MRRCSVCKREIYGSYYEDGYGRITCTVRCAIRPPDATRTESADPAGATP